MIINFFYSPVQCLPWCRSFWCGGDADHVGVPDGHHAKGDVLAAGVVGAPDLDRYISLMSSKIIDERIELEQNIYNSHITNIAMGKRILCFF